MKKQILTLLIAGCFASALTGCNSSGPSVSVKVHDGYMTSLYEVPKGTSVKDALVRGEILLHDKDATSPKLSEKVTEDNTEIAIQRSATVQLSEDGKTSSRTLMGKKVKDLLSESDISIGKYDLVNHDKEAYLEDGMDVRVVHRCRITLSADGHKKKVITEAKTVKELLEKENISLGKNDRVKPKLTASIKEGSKIIVNRVDIKEKKEKVDIPYETRYENTSSMYSGSTKVKQQGVNGKKEITYKITYVDGKEESRKAVKEKVIKKPVSKIVLRGTKSRPKRSRKSSGGKGKKRYRIIVDCDGSIKKVPY